MPDGIHNQPVDVWSDQAQITEVRSNASWSPNEDNVLIAQVRDRDLHVFSEDERFDDHVARDTEGIPYTVKFQHGNRWLDGNRLIFWELERGKAFLWDVVSQTESEILGITEKAHFVFSPNGETLYMQRRESSSDIWLLEMSSRRAAPDDRQEKRRPDQRQRDATE